MEDSIHKELVKVNEKLDIIIELLNNSQKSCDKMVEHIDFVDSVYKVVRHPLNSMVKYIQGSTDKSLPQPKHEDAELALGLRHTCTEP